MPGKCRRVTSTRWRLPPTVSTTTCVHRVHRHTKATLLGHAASESVDTFRRRCQVLARRLVAAHSGSDAEELDRQRAASNVKRWVDKVTGMAHTHLQLDPVRDQMLWKAINHHLTRLRQQDQQGSGRTAWAQLQVDAVIAAVSDTGGGATGSVRVPEIGVLVDYTTLAADAAAGGLCNIGEGGL